MGLKRTTPPVAPAVSLSEMKDHLRETDSSQDALIGQLLMASTRACEQECHGIAIMDQRWTLTLDAFPDAIKLERVPVRSLVSLKYSDSNGVQQTLSTSAYALDNKLNEYEAWVVPAYGGEWPLARAQVNSIEIEFQCGWSTAAEVPDQIKAWIKLHAAALYENRESTNVGNITSEFAFFPRLLDEFRLSVL